jgi:tRNA A37 threonylcarbamoyladenosine synthetase subunit TsaC/SUA5/YrdC
VKRNTNFQIINEGAIGVIPTDTLYGLVGSAFNKSAVERIYKVRKMENLE